MIPRSSASLHFNSQCFGSFFPYPSYPDAFFVHSGDFPLMIAAKSGRKGYPDIVGALLKKGAQVDAIVSCGSKK